MAAWRQVLSELRAESQASLTEIGRLIEQLAKEPSDRLALGDLQRRFHALAGSAAPHGLPQLRAFATEGERACAALAREAATPRPASLERLRELLAGLAAQLSAPIGQPVGEGEGRGFPTAEPPFVLVVAGEETVRDSLTERLRQVAMTARGAATRAEADLLLETRLPDGIIVDVALPDGLGYQFVERLRTLPGGDVPAVLLLSLKAGFLDKVEAIGCGADGFFERPIDWDALLRRLQLLLERNRAEPGRILMVEEDAREASYLSAVLQSGGYEVRSCDDPGHFEGELAAFRPDLVLIDVLLPGVSGYELVRYVRQDEQHATLPILFLTTEAEAEAEIANARAGGDGHLGKPILPGLLLSAVTARVERARVLKALVGRDGLTRLLSHTSFLEQARVTVVRKRRDPDRSLAWVMIDLDRFKVVNDRYGHPVGDRVLTSLATLLRRRLRQSDTLGRYGGEEFAVLLDDLSQDQALRLVSRLLEEFGGVEHRTPQGSFRVTCSAGIAMLDPWMDLEWWRRAADDALLAAKGQGRARVILAPPSAAPAHRPPP